MHEFDMPLTYMLASTKLGSVEEGHVATLHRFTRVQGSDKEEMKQTPWASYRDRSCIQYVVQSVTKMQQAVSDDLKRWSI